MKNKTDITASARGCFFIIPLRQIMRDNKQKGKAFSGQKTAIPETFLELLRTYDTC